MHMTSVAASAGLIGLLAVPAAGQDWSPSEPVSIVVPWSAGGSTDSVTRVVAQELSDAFGQTFVVLNQPGASGSVGTKSVWDAPHDGMTMAAGAAAGLGAYPVLGMLDATLSDWRLYLHVANPSLVSVNADTPYQDFGALLEALKTSEDPITVASAGLTSAGAIALDAIAGTAEINTRSITYEGGAPAVTSTVAGETQMTAQTAVEQVDMIRAGRLRPLAVVADTPLELDGYGTVPPITDWLPDIAVAPNYFGLFIPADAPAEVLAAMDKVWEERIATSEKMKTYAAERASLFNPSYGDSAQDAAMPFLSINAWQQYEGGTAPNDPSEFGIPKPE
ncbi:tripartite tricarboxylate transporter substrate binding protein [Rhodobacteraceae bacterium 2CG4]|uniref:Tripartite tricarboxylate transporter substrate binding protein n=1 Tax=Halovulum marinum TaxID=2662447 RepID=A0A6L5Z137_9RHOB|nr:tripartite tricarboxylate transporter substrate binding protein [Halovulum marinum]MSU90286.1 tripartite tricarboxylate transporter substrate binding protein [Halovulum marinum]